MQQRECHLVIHEHNRYCVPGAVGALGVVTLVAAVVALGVVTLVVAVWGQWSILSFAFGTCKFTQCVCVCVCVCARARGRSDYSI